MKTLLRRFVARTAPLVCGECEGGSGAWYDAERGLLAVCPACDGSGRAREAAPAAIVSLPRRRKDAA